MLPEDVTSLLSSIESLGTLPDAVLEAAAKAVEPLAIGDGTVLIRSGDSSDSLYIVASGCLRVTISVAGRDELIAECGARDVVGEIAFLTGEARSATVLAKGDTAVLRLSRAAYEALAQRHPEIVVRLTAALVDRLRRSQLGLALHRHPLFAALDDAVLRDIESELELLTLPSGQVLFQQGDAGDALYLVISGRVRVVSTQDTGEERVLGEIGGGETVGEMAILGGETRSATVYAVRDSNLARLSSAGFGRLSAMHPHAVLPMFTRRIVMRAHEQLMRPARAGTAPNTIAVAPISPGVDVAAFCDALRLALCTFGRVLHLDSSGFDILVGRPGASATPEDDVAHSLIVERLGMLEAEHQYVIYQTDAEPSAWTRRAVRQADHILLVGASDARPEPEDFERQICAAIPDRRRTRMSLVLLHQHAARRPNGTSRWLNARALDGHYHVRVELDEDVQRLARILSGHGIGVVLGGGFARGIGQFGVLRAMRQLGIPVDFVGGTSMGGAIAVECAYGFDLDEMVQVTCDTMLRSFRGDATFPFVAFMKGQRGAGLIRAILDDRDLDIEDLWLPCFLVSANLTRATVHVHRRGSVIKSIMTSCRPPGVFPPVVWDGDLHVDGGIANNVPADVMKDFTRGATVIAVDASPNVDPAMTADYGLGVSGWRVLANRLNPFGAKKPAVPHLFSILLRTLEFAGAARRRTAAESADLYLRPPLETFRIGDFRRGREIADVAYQHALPRLKAWMDARIHDNQRIRMSAILQAVSDDSIMSG